jgi:hypothetical protein
MTNPADVTTTGLPATKIVQAWQHRVPKDGTATEILASARAVERAKGCSHPVRLTGSIEVTDDHTGVLVHWWSTARDTLTGVAYVPCKTRRAAKCPSCAALYQGDAFRLIAEGLRGGEFIPETVRDHPAVFVTFTAPSFGPVHSQRRDAHGEVLRCRPRRGGERCPHGRELSCGARHDEGDAGLGQAICSDCFDYEAAARWNAHTGELWRATRVNLDRALARRIGLSVRTMRQSRCRTQYVKIAEFQARGLVHFHVAIRLDGIDGAAPDVDLEDLVEAITTAHSQTDVPAGDDQRLGWGTQLDIKVIGAHIGRERLAGYFAKYATKGSDAKGLLHSRIRTANQLDYLPVNPHLARLVRSAWGLATDEVERGLDRWAHQFGFRGHFLTKSRSWSTTFKVLRQRRADHHAHEQRQAWQAMAPEAELVVTSDWEFAGIGYRTALEADLAAVKRTIQLLSPVAA